jgi:hypothetical protein
MKSLKSIYLGEGMGAGGERWPKQCIHI